ncbi:hypothetical protein [Candidatus Glomeribacter gigasporarum]|uniref:hypothetical protein n=1 Tax=Candidatus Glomeribacter gigasporarum TaxID=132144 RepID=UPI00131542FD|nr:hypothetical protein [Candidatus Glomeribacter gigasporarum]
MPPFLIEGGNKTALQASCHDTSILGASAPVVHLPYNVALPILFYQGQPVITLAMMDKAHRRPEDTAGRNFRAHQNKLIEGKDDFVRNSYEAKELGITAPNGLILLTKPAT